MEKHLHKIDFKTPYVDINPDEDLQEMLKQDISKHHMLILILIHDEYTIKFQINFKTPYVDINHNCFIKIYSSYSSFQNTIC